MLVSGGSERIALSHSLGWIAFWRNFKLMFGQDEPLAQHRGIKVAMLKLSLPVWRKPQPTSRADNDVATGDAALIERICQRDMRAFEELYRQYHPRLNRFLMNILYHSHLTEEVLNDTLMVVWKKPESYNGTSKVSTWIFGIAYRTALKARARYKAPVSDEAVHLEPSPEPAADMQIGQRQLQELLMEAVSSLSTDHRAVVDLAYFHHMGCEEISDILKCPVGTVKTRLFHARKHLKKMLAGQCSDWL